MLLSEFTGEVGRKSPLIRIKTSKDLIEQLEERFRAIECKESEKAKDEIKNLIDAIRSLKTSLQEETTYYRCHKCGRDDFESIHESMTHTNKCNGILECKSCGKNDFSGIMHYNDHAKACGRLQCDVCGKNDFGSKRYYNDHVKACGDKLKCKRCGRSNFNNKRHFDDHVKACQANLTCDFCLRNNFNSKKHYDDHVKACGGKLLAPNARETRSAPNLLITGI